MNGLIIFNSKVMFGFGNTAQERLKREFDEYNMITRLILHSLSIHTVLHYPCGLWCYSQQYVLLGSRSLLSKINLKLNSVCWHSKALSLTSLLWIEILDILQKNHHHRIRVWEMENSVEIFSSLFDFVIEMRLKFTNHYKLLSCPL